MRTGSPGAAWSLESFCCSLQPRAAGDPVALHRAVRVAVGDELRKLASLLPGLSAALPEQLTVNGAGAFDVGGPEGDNGLSGKKLVMDAYGPRVPIGGGAWSGKDFFKADRAGGMRARRLAKFVVGLGLASEARVTLQWFSGDGEARVVDIETPEGQGVSARAVARCVDLKLERSGEDFALDNLVEVARWGHFERRDFAWELTRKMKCLIRLSLHFYYRSQGNCLKTYSVIYLCIHFINVDLFLLLCDNIFILSASS